MMMNLIANYHQKNKINHERGKTRAGGELPRVEAQSGLAQASFIIGLLGRLRFRLRSAPLVTNPLRHLRRSNSVSATTRYHPWQPFCQSFCAVAPVSLDGSLPRQYPPVTATSLYHPWQPICQSFWTEAHHRPAAAPSRSDPVNGGAGALNTNPDASTDKRR